MPFYGMLKIIKREIECEIREAGENRDELSDNPSKTSMNRRT
jgi:hypothetical protein